MVQLIPPLGLAQSLAVAVVNAHHDLCRPQYFVVVPEKVPSSYYLDHGVIGHALIVDTVYSFLELRIERLAFGVYWADALLLQQLIQLILGQSDAFDNAFAVPPGRLTIVKRSLEVVFDAQQ